MSDLNFLKSLGKVKPSDPTPPVPNAPAPVVAAPKVSTGLRLGLKASNQTAKPASELRPDVQSTGVPATTAPAEPNPSVGGVSSGEPGLPATTEEVAKGPAGFKAILDSFDALVGASVGISALDLDNARNYVARVMTELKTNPEMQAFVIDRDVHNIMKYVQASASIAGQNFVTKASTRAKKEAKAQAAASVSLEMFDDQVDVAAQMAALKAKRAGGKPASAPLSIQDLSSINTDDIEAKDRK